MPRNACHGVQAVGVLVAIVFITSIFPQNGLSMRMMERIVTTLKTTSTTTSTTTETTTTTSSSTTGKTTTESLRPSTGRTVSNGTQVSGGADIAGISTIPSLSNASGANFDDTDAKISAIPAADEIITTRLIDHNVSQTSDRVIEKQPYATNLTQSTMIDGEEQTSTDYPESEPEIQKAERLIQIGSMKIQRKWIMIATPTCLFCGLISSTIFSLTFFRMCD